MIHVGRNTFYGGMDMIQNRGSLYYLPPLTEKGKRFIHLLMEYIDSNAVARFHIWAEGSVCMGMEYIEDGAERDIVFILKGTRIGLSVLSCLRRIQRAVRLFLQARRQARFTALAMGLHPRLGKESVLSGVCADILYSLCHWKPVYTD